MNKILLSLFLIINSLILKAQQNPLILSENQTFIEKQNELSQFFVNYKFLSIASSHDYSIDVPIHIQFLDNTIVELDMKDADVITNQFPVFIDGIAKTFIKENRTVQSFYKTTKSGYIRGVINDNMLYSLIYNNGDTTYYIERMQKFIPDSDDNIYILYMEGDSVIPNGTCSVSSIEKLSNDMKSRIYSEVERRVMTDECINIKLAIGCPSNMFSHYGSIANVESEITTIINSIASNFDTYFNKRIDFEITSINVATSSSSSLDTDIGSLTDYIDILNVFKDWSNNGNLTSQDYDIGILFTRTDFDGTPVGGAFRDALCSNPLNKYIVIQDGLSLGLAKNLVSHEIGHSFGCVHTSSGIMTASVSASTSWDISSIDIINDKEQSSDCNFGSGLLEGTPNAQFLLAEKACKDEVIVLRANDSRNTTTWNWSFSEGAPQSGQEITTSFSTLGFKDVSLTLQNSYTNCNNTSAVNTQSIEVLDLVPPQNASCSTIYDSNAGTDNDVMSGIINVSFGLIDNDSEDAFINKLVLENHTCSSTTVEEVDSTVSLSITKGTGSFNIFTKAWLDYNNDGNFTADELLLDNDSSNQTISENIVLSNPNIVFDTLLRLRIITDLNTISNACIKPTFGQVEDYGVIIQNSLSLDEFNITEAIHLTENPFSEQATIIIPVTGRSNKVKVSLYDALGKFYGTQIFLPNNEHYTIQTKELSNGIYYLAVEVDGKVMKVIKGIKE